MSFPSPEDLPGLGIEPRSPALRADALLPEPPGKTCLVAKSCPILCDCSPPGSSVHGILQARILEWVAISFSRGSSRPRDGTSVSCLDRQILYQLRHLGSSYLSGIKRLGMSALPSWESKTSQGGRSCSTQHKSQNEGRSRAPGSEKLGGHRGPTGQSQGPSLKLEAWGGGGSWWQQDRDPALPRQSVITGRGCWASLPGAQGKREKTGLAPASGYSSRASCSEEPPDSPLGILDPQRGLHCFHLKPV